MAAGDYEGALTEFFALGSYSDAAEQAHVCQQAVDYRKAAALMKNGDYKGALAIFTALGDYEDAVEQAHVCSQVVDYDTAITLMEGKHYEEAADLFASLGDYRDAADRTEECRYNRAGQLFKSGKYYSAYLMYMALGDYGDSVECAESCAQPFPDTGVTYQDPQYEGNISITFTAPKDGCYAVVRIFGNGLKWTNGNISRGSWVATICIAPGKKVTIKLRNNTAYYFEEAHGTAWYGMDELFGDEGTYSVLTTSDGELIYFTMGSFYKYEIKLRQTYFSVRWYTISREDF